jgi:branched-chain amino acid transport system permease protein
MDFYFGLLQTIGVHTLLGLSAYVVLQTGQVTMAQAAFFGIGAYTASMMTAVVGLHIVPAVLIAGAFTGCVAALTGFPALRFKGLMLVVATTVFGEFIRMFFFNFKYQVTRAETTVGPVGAEGFRQIRWFLENGWRTVDVTMLIWAFVVAVMLVLWWMDRSRIGTVLRAVGEDETAAQSVGINLTAVKVSAFAIGGVIAGIGGALFAHYTTHIEHSQFNVLLATFAIAYPILGGLSGVMGTLLAVLLIQGVIVQGLPRLIGDDLRNLLFGPIIVLAMILRPSGLLDARSTQLLRNLFRGRSARADA